MLERNKSLRDLLFTTLSEKKSLENKKTLIHVRDFVGNVGLSQAVLFIDLTSSWVSLATLTFFCLKEDISFHRAPCP